MEHTTLQILFYFVLAISVTFYVVLDGFDLGVGILLPFARQDGERRIFLNSIGPVWDGNEVWLVIVIGGLFAGFPPVYATLFSGFYDLCMILIAALIFRAVAIEFRSKRPSPVWRGTWDWVFALASFVIAFGLGVVLGNLVQGVPLTSDGVFEGSFSLFFRPYSVLLGFTSAAIMAMHGSIYLTMKTEGTLHEQLKRWSMHCIGIFLLFYFLSTYATLIYLPHMTARMRDNPALFSLGVLSLLAILNVSREFFFEHSGRAFISSCVGIALLFALYGLGSYPNLVRSTIRPEEYSLTVFNASSSPLTLIVLLCIVAIGVPLVLAYGTFIYRTFRGKVKLTSTSY